MSENSVVLRGQTLPIKSMQDIGQMGSWLAKSGMCGCKTVEQGIVLAMACVSTGKSPIELVEDNHIIAGKMSKRADSMLASLLDYNGDYDIIERNADIASIYIECGRRKGTFSFSWKEAQDEPFIFEKDGTTIKDNYKTPRKRMQMLWSRVVSDGVRVCCPKAAKGLYPPEIVQEFGNENMPAREKPVEVELINPGGDVVEIPPEQPIAKKAVAKIDYTKMPIGKMTGKSFDDFDTKTLEQVIKLSSDRHPLITQKHKENAKASLAKQLTKKGK